jgi:D-alanyl-D-alanine carboxypeptidase (penicillin-binding protein 5/6)
MFRATHAARAAVAGVVAVSVVGLTGGARTAPAGAQQPPNAAPPKAWIVVDAGTGHVLEAGADHVPYSPASMSKVMTALTVIERLPSTAMVTVTPLAQAKGMSNLTATGMKAGQRWPLDLTLGVLLVISGNDAAYSLATTTAGGLPQFAADETATSNELGLRDSTFADPAGLDGAEGFGGGPRMSAYDVAISVRNALAVPELAHWASTPQFSYTDPLGAHHTVQNHNKLLLPGPKQYPNATGFKTGYTSLAGNTLAATATRNGRTIIAVVMNTYDTYGWAGKLLDDGFRIPATAPGNGEVLPAVAVSTYAERAADRAAFLALARAQSSTGGNVAEAGTAVAGNSPSTLPPLSSITTYHATTSTSPAPSTTVASHGATSGGAAHLTGDLASSSHSGGGSSWFNLWTVVILLLLVAVVVVLLRRRAVRRRRAKRLARRRMMQAALRRGSLPVVDGKYRPGMRTGNPVPSHVKIHRDGDDG